MKPEKIAARGMLALTKAAGILGMAWAGIMAAGIVSAAASTGVLAISPLLSSVALGAISLAGYRSASSAGSMMDGYITETASPFTSSIARWGGVLLTLGGIAMAVSALSAPLVLPEMALTGAIFTAVGMGTFKSGQMAVETRNYAIAHKHQRVEPRPHEKLKIRAHAPSQMKEETPDLGDKPVLGVHTEKLATSREHDLASRTQR